MEKVKEFFNYAWQELHQITWLTKDQAIRYSIITISFVFLSAVVLWGVDTLLTELYKLIQQ